jgi:hypothetical protein
MRLGLAILALVAFVGWSLWWVHDEGLPGLFALLVEHDWGAQVFVDLCISLSVAWAFIRPDARARGLPLVPYVLATPFVGSIALLTYLVHRELRALRARG